MMKKNKLSLALALLIGGASAANAGFGGFYVGGQLGLALMQGTHTYTNGGTTPGTQKAKAFGYLGGLNAGYLRQPGDSNVILGGELYFLLAGPKASKDLQIPGGPIEGKANLSHKYAMGGALILGTLMNPKVMVYGKLAYEFDKFDLKYTGLTFQAPNSQDFKKTTTGFVPGAGLLYKVNTSLLVGGEYGYAMMKKMQPRKDSVAINGVQRGFMFTPSEHRITAKVIYLF
jgi:opacity protein-like surface antigen